MTDATREIYYVEETKLKLSHTCILFTAAADVQNLLQGGPWDLW